MDGGVTALRVRVSRSSEVVRGAHVRRALQAENVRRVSRRGFGEPCQAELLPRKDVPHRYKVDTAKGSREKKINKTPKKTGGGPRSSGLRRAGSVDLRKPRRRCRLRCRGVMGIT